MPSLLERLVPTAIVASVHHRVYDPEPEARIALTENELFEILSDSRRRAVIERVADVGRDEAVARSELAREIAAAETHMSPEDVPQERITPVDVELSRLHFPMLDDAGLIRWNVTSGEISPGHSIDPIVACLQALDRRIDPIPLHQPPTRPPVRSSMTRR